MNVIKTLSTAALVTVLGATAACGGKSSSAATADSPRDADQKTFCSTLTNLASNVTPKDAVDKIKAVGTPSGIDAKARAGYETLLNELAKLPDNAKASDFSSLQKNVSAADTANVQAFFTYFVTTCKPTAIPSPAQ